MKLGASLTFDNDRIGIDTNTIIEAARLVETIGYDSLWVYDCIGRNETIPDPLVLLGIIGATTDAISIGTGVIQLPLRNTAILAHQILTAHLVCGDRLRLGVGFGSTRVDFKTVGYDFAQRKQYFLEQIPILKALLTTGKCGGIELSPWPLRKNAPPLLLGTWGKHIKTAALKFDGWIASGFYRNNLELAKSLAKYRSVGGKNALVTNVAYDKKSGVTPVIDRLLNLKEIGFDEAIVFAPIDALCTIKEGVTND